MFCPLIKNECRNDCMYNNEDFEEGDWIGYTKLDRKIRVMVR